MQPIYTRSDRSARQPAFARVSHFGAGLCAAIGLLVPGTAYAYDLEGFAWPGEDPTTAPLILRVDGWPSDAGSATAIEAAMEGAIATWNEQGASNLHVVYGGASSANLNDTDSLNVVGYEPLTTDDHTLAVSRWLTASEGTRIVSCDVHVWAANVDGQIQWSTATQPPSNGAYDLQHVLTHEIGHCLGLAHSTDPTAIMYATTNPGTALRDLSADDVLGLQAIYGPGCDDADGDGYAPSSGCELPGPDCDDQDPNVHPGVDEVCNGADDNCNGDVDDNAIDGVPLHTDADGDGYGDNGDAVTGCEEGPFTSDSSDCNDDDEYVHPNADDPQDGFDQDCDGSPESAGCAATEGPPPSHTLAIEGLLMLALMRRRRSLKARAGRVRYSHR